MAFIGQRPSNQPPLPPPAPPSGGGLRYDAGKNRLDLLPPEWIWGLGKVTTAGALKYADRNWEKGMPWSKVWGPMLRHAFKWLLGEAHDKETGCHHLLMVAWNALALFTYELREIGENDLNQQYLADGEAEAAMGWACLPPQPAPEGSPTELSLFHGIRNGHDEAEEPIGLPLGS